MRVPLTSLALLALCPLAHAELRLPKLFGDHMVLQQKTQAPIWGWANPGQKVQVTASWGATVEATAGWDRRWRVNLPTTEAGGPWEVTVSTSGEKVEIKDVLLGEVWLCSGQSNMEWRMRQINAASDVAAATNSQIRHFKVGLIPMQHSAEDVTGEWVVCSPQSVLDFTATGYYFATALYDRLEYPVGLINSSWGGTQAELWVSEPTFLSEPQFKERAVTPPPMMYGVARTEYFRQLSIGDLGLHGRWFEPELNEYEWQPAASTLFSQVGLTNFDGVLWFRGDIELSAPVNGASVDFGPIDDHHTVYVNGRMLGQELGAGANRTYGIPNGVLKAGKNVVTVRVVDTGGEGGFRNNMAIVRSGQSATLISNWRFRKGSELQYIPSTPQGGEPYSLLHYGMIAPIVPYAIKGALWYQGESNVGRGYQYRDLMPMLIQDWRKQWGSDFPFYMVQIAPFVYGGPADSTASAELRESQLLTMLRTPKVGMAVISDGVDNVNDIHPVNKRVVGERLAAWALNRDYGFKDKVPSGPVYRSMKVAGNEARLTFDYADGLTWSPDQALGFQIAGTDKVFHPATARVEGRTVIVTSPNVAKPAAVRFGWGNLPSAGLKNGAEIPASSFRTDNWQTQTQGVRW